MITPILQIRRNPATMKLSGSKWQSQGSNPVALHIDDTLCFSVRLLAEIPLR